jgi:hypothetical protein
MTSTPGRGYGRYGGWRFSASADGFSGSEDLEGIHGITLGDHDIDIAVKAVAAGT